MGNLEKDIINLVRERGPQTGLDIKKAIDGDSLIVWKTCKSSPDLLVQNLGRKYMRLDRHVDGLARLSPSILREFFTYSVVGSAEKPELIERRCTEIVDRINDISRYKRGLAQQMVLDMTKDFHDKAIPDHQICFILAGDIVYNMAHDVPRPERSTGRLVRGSDIDIVVVVDDSMPDTFIDRLDRIIYQKKYRMLIDPALNEEVDYKIKKLALIRQQSHFDCFKHMVACKILQEGVLLYGNETLFHTVKTILKEMGVLDKLEVLETLANTFREKAEESILVGGLDRAEIEKKHLFYSVEEFEEFE